MARAEITWRSCIFGESAGYMGKPDVSQTSCRRHDDTHRSRPFAMCVKQKHRLTRSPGPGGRRSRRWPGCRWPGLAAGASISVVCAPLRGCGVLSPGCRAVELSRLRRGAVEALSRPCLSSLCPVEFLSSSCRGPVEFVEVEVCRGLSRSVELSSCRAVLCI